MCPYQVCKLERGVLVETVPSEVQGPKLALGQERATQHGRGPRRGIEDLRHFLGREATPDVVVGQI